MLACTIALTLKLVQVSEAAEQTALEICAAEHTTELMMQVLGIICVASMWHCHMRSSCIHTSDMLTQISELLLLRLGSFQHMNQLSWCRKKTLIRSKTCSPCCTVMQPTCFSSAPTPQLVSTSMRHICTHKRATKLRLPESWRFAALLQSL